MTSWPSLDEAPRINAWLPLDEAPIEEDVLLYLPDGCQQVGWARWRLDDHTISTDPEALCWAPLPDPPPS